MQYLLLVAHSLTPHQAQQTQVKRRNIVIKRLIRPFLQEVFHLIAVGVS
jgi:hypothetical protein